MTEHKVGTREEWLAARRGLLEREKELTRLNDELTRERRELPWVPVEKEYRFETDEGTKTLAELFDGRSQLLVYHLMFGPEWTAACPGCSGLADHLDGALPHLNARDVTMICISHAPHEKVQAYRRRMGWTFPYVSSFGSDFNFDFGVSFTEEQRRNNDAEYNFERVDFAKVLEEFAGNESMAEAAASCGTDLAGYVTTEGPGLSAFALSEGVVYHTYSSYAPESNFMVFSGQLLERAPKGGDDNVATLRHDEYEDVAGTTGVTSVQPLTARKTSSPEECAMSLPQVVSEVEWSAAREELLVEEKEATRARDTLAAKRRRLPMVRIDKDYAFEGPDGKASLLDLFDGRRQLILYHFMFAAGVDGWPSAGCDGCSMFVDNVGHLAHLHARDTSFVLVSLAPRAQIESYNERMGWTVPWYSSIGSDFNVDFGVTTDGGETFGLSVFLRDGGSVYRTYFTSGRGTEALGSSWTFLDLTPLGRQETWEDSPPGWPQTAPYEWWRRHDEYETAVS